VSRSALATVLGVDVRSIANYVDEGMPRDERALYPLARCVQWYVDRERSAARATKGLNDLDRARLRKTDAEAHKAELEAKQLSGDLIPMTDHEEIVGEVCDRLRATIVNIPGNFGTHLEEAGVSAADAEAVLERVAEELITALRGTADELDDEANADATSAMPDAKGDARAG
jgi:phage terminase Nu1 subunit (DNA packaging protein)